MPFPHVEIIKYLPREDQGRTCPICSSQVALISDGLKGLYKCMNCGYSRLSGQNIPGQHAYDLPIMLAHTTNEFLVKRGWFELYQPIDELLFNILVAQDWPTEDAVKQVVRDLNMDKNTQSYFYKKIKFLDGEKDEEPDEKKQEADAPREGFK